MLKKLKDGVIYRLKGFWGEFNRFFYKSPHVLNTVDSLQKVIDYRCSLARFGDGEFNLMRGTKLGFQDADQSLADRLKEVLKTPVTGLEIGIPDIFGDLSAYTTQAKRFWKSYMGMHRNELVKMLDANRTYLNTNMTRFWSGYKDKNAVEGIIQQYRRIWEGRDLVFVEGSFTRMGVGNDLFSDAKSVKRVLCPATNAYNHYNEIKKVIEELCLPKETLFILALGPTATVLAYDLTRMGYQALDLGHIDVQYEYSLRKATEKIAIEGKYVNENVDGRNVSDSIIDSEYLESIIARIE